MTEIVPPNPAPEIVENLAAPEILARDAIWFATGDDLITVTLVADKFDVSVTPPECKRVVVGRLTMPARGAQTLAVNLFDVLRRIGYDAVPPDVRAQAQ